MKKRIILLLALLLLTGCSAQSDTERGESPADSETADAAEVQAATEAGETQPETEDAAENAADAEETDSAEPEPESDLIAQVTIDTVTESLSTEDGVELIHAAWPEITVSIPGRPEVEENIRANLNNLLSELSLSNSDLSQAVQEWYDYTLEEGTEWVPCECTLNVEVMRRDEQVLSLYFQVYLDSGGVHGNVSTYCTSYDMESGSPLTLSFLSAQGASFYDTALELVEALSLTEAYEGLFFEETLSAEELSYVVRDNCFYLDEEGVVFLADPYLIGPYASGIIEFHLPYADLQGVIKDNYLPTQSNK